MKTLLSVCVCIAYCILAHSEASAADPYLLHKRGRRMVNAARIAASRGEDNSSLGRYRKAENYLRSLREEYPDYEAPRVKADLESCRQQIDLLEGKLHPIPNGYIRVWPGMAREGTRYSKAELLARRVKKRKKDTYKVGKRTVRLSTSGGETSAACDCPDYMYRGRGAKSPCKHIWAVVISENVFGESAKK